MAWTIQIEYARIEIVTPLGAGIARLTNHGQGHATGRFLSHPAYFMPLRHQPARPDLTELGELIQTARKAPGSSTRPYEYDASIYRSNEARFWLDLTQPDVGTANSADCAIAYHPDGSWARLAGGLVTQGGPRQLWNDIENSHRTWLDAGRPDRDRHTLEATDDGTLHILRAGETTPVHTIH